MRYCKLIMWLTSMYFINCCLCFSITSWFLWSFFSRSWNENQPHKSINRVSLKWYKSHCNFILTGILTVKFLQEKGGNPTSIKVQLFTNSLSFHCYRFSTQLCFFPMLTFLLLIYCYGVAIRKTIPTNVHNIGFC